jgi:hypothetical protein
LGLNITLPAEKTNANQIQKILTARGLLVKVDRPDAKRIVRTYVEVGDAVT